MARGRRCSARGGAGKPTRSASVGDGTTRGRRRSERGRARPAVPHASAAAGARRSGNSAGEASGSASSGGGTAQGEEAMAGAQAPGGGRALARPPVSDRRGREEDACERRGDWIRIILSVGHSQQLVFYVTHSIY